MADAQQAFPVTDRVATLDQTERTIGADGDAPTVALAEARSNQPLDADTKGAQVAASMMASASSSGMAIPSSYLRMLRRPLIA